MYSEEERIQRRERITLWHSNFMFTYHPDPVVDIDLKNIVDSLLEIEQMKGTNLVTEDTIPEIEANATELYRYAGIKARRWGMPITQIGLLIAILGCDYSTDVDIILAVLYKCYMIRKRKEDNLIDGLFVWETLHHGMPSRAMFNEAWKVLTLDGKSSILDTASIKDFQ